jgi:hypothetical protein
MIDIFNTLTNFFGCGNYQFGIKKEPNADSRGWIIPVSRMISGNDTDDTRPAVATDLVMLAQRQALKNSIVIRPLDASHYILLDDCDATEHINKPGRLILVSSPNNYQIWIKADRAVSDTEKSFWIAKLGADINCYPAGRWGKCPGYINYKIKHADNPPLVDIKYFDCTNAVLPYPDVVEYKNYLNPTSIKTTKYIKINNRIIKSKYRADFSNGDESSTDLRYALYLLRCGFDLQDIKALIQDERTDWTNKKGMEARYINTVVNKAVSIFKN